jgi:hypothetical protein
VWLGIRELDLAASDDLEVLATDQEAPLDVARFD